MKKFTLSFAYVALFAIVFTSCSKDENPNNINGETTTLSFATMLNDLAENKAALKQSTDEIPQCSDAAPAYVEVVVTGPENVGSNEAPYRIDVSPTPGDYDGDGEDEYFTKESTDLELPPGTYTLEYFKVFDADGNEIWVAPMTGSEMASFVDSTLPMSFDLAAGTKKYIDVEVLCFDDRFVNEYGYLFFDIMPNQAIEFCIFGNYCDDNGRHFPAHFRVEVWTYSGNSESPKGAPLFDAENPYINEVGVNNNGDAFANPLCLPLPDKEGVDRYYGEVYVLEFGNENDEGRLVVSGVFTDTNVKNLFGQDDTLDYYHFRENCELGNTGF